MQCNGGLATALREEQDSFASNTQRALSEAFGVPFDLWVWQESWVPMDLRGASAVRSPREADRLRRLMDSFLIGGSEPKVVAQSRGRYVLAIPLEKNEQTVVVATASVSMSHREILQRMARMLVRDLARQDQLEASDTALKACAAEISHDFEELVFLRNLAHNMEIRDDSPNGWPVAQQALPFLQRLIDAEVMILVAAGQPQQAGGAPSAAIGAPAVWIGPNTIDQDTCRRLVETYAATAVHHPVVKNHFDKTWDGRTFPGVHSFILVSATQRDFTAGWVLALNRLPPKVMGTGLIERHSFAPTAREYGPSQNEFGSIEAGLLASTVTIIATYRRNCELFREKEALLVNVVRSLASAIDAKDPYTCGHSERVATLASRLGKELRLNDRECEHLHMTGLLHDIGKIGVSESVLRKPGRLTPEEFDDIKRHPAIGHAILRDLTQLSYVLPGVRHHHENYNGTGYPDGLAGDKIPFHARVLAVADSYDAMSSDRPYRPGMGQDRIVEIFRSGSATQWDPNVVACFLRLLPEDSVLCRDSTRVEIAPV